MPSGPLAWAVVVAAGSGSRFGSYKQFARLGGREVVEWSLEAAGRCCAGAVLVVPAELVASHQGKADSVVAGEATRAGSVRAGLAAVPAQVDIVVVHDAARPLASDATWRAVIAAVSAGAEAAVPCVPVTDTIKQRVAEGRLVTLPRGTLVAAQTPQAFRASSLRSAHAGEAEATDDASLVEAAGGQVVEVPGEPGNLKITAPSDLAVAEALLRTSARSSRGEVGGAGGADRAGRAGL
ncbi:MAG TPA: 2-C-methyl-D-erythritol 4-phosphate cytidylyltransferase [Acidimicrobiales bacterium]|nr:2-C-methyl-D-erythritol 4-phosphate cytidylyltransferase [Acidimicrobiales bacterium]